MIKNERQYQVTQRKYAEFIDTLAIMKNHYQDNPEELELRAGFIVAELEILREDIEDYEKLKERRLPNLPLTDFSKIADLLIKGRIAKGWTHADLATKLGLKPQQVQRYEGTDYETAALARIIQVFRALQLDIRTCKIGYGEPHFNIPAANENPQLRSAREKIRKQEQLLVFD